MILVALGTHHEPFERLLRAVEEATDGLGGEEVVVQAGASARPLRGCRVVATLDPGELTTLLDAARLVVLHGGSSLFLEARALGRVPIVVPRRARFGEHVDDHQVEFAASLAPSEALVCEPEALPAVLRGWREPRGTPIDRSAAFARGLSAAIESIRRARGR
jgi:UDP-N-acetylglucosamine transferase subunit ALG13